MKKKKGFTLVELLVVIAIIALLMGILMPALARVRQIAYRLYCGTNLSGIGKAMLIYGNDYDDEMPRAGLPNTVWGKPIANWRDVPRPTAFGTGVGTISACFYELVKYTETTPKSFLCKGDSGATEFVPMDEPNPPGANVELVDLWDFGQCGQSHCSYAYHSPYGQFALTSSSEPGMAVAADPNPWLNTADNTKRDPADFTVYRNAMNRGPSNPPTKDEIEHGNALTHQGDGQNVLFMDGHTSVEKNSACGLDEDNIYTAWGNANGSDKKTGANVPGPGAVPISRNDSLLMTDDGCAASR
jgi:prepilin-type N-terminal cleavage/methylation domain-containing protein/prepilin-type processing-associated H-X9-DG protein